MVGEVVAYFDILTAGVEYYDSNRSIEICGNEQFILGRDPELCRHCWSDDHTISRQHVRVHCVLYEQDPISNIAPFIYVTDLSANGTYLKSTNIDHLYAQDYGLLMRRNRAYLLNEGDELHLSDNVRLHFRPALPYQAAHLTAVQEKEKAVFAQQYSITGRLLGEGGCGKVLVGLNQATQHQLACKIIRLDHLYGKANFPKLHLPTGEQEQHASGRKGRWPTRVAACFREFDILKDLSHPNIIAIEKVFWSHNTIYLFQELITGGDLFSFLEFNEGRLDNAQAAVVIRQVLIGVNYLHDRGIVHRDLKPDNILMTSLADGARVVITDFGNARFLPNTASSNHQSTAKSQRMFSYVGTLEYAAPEIHQVNPTIPTKGGYSRSVDMWSIGSITAILLTGDVVFTDRRHPEYERNPKMVIMGLAAQCDLSVLDEEDHPSWSTVAHSAKDFIKRLLVLDERARMTAIEALAHDWFANEIYAEDMVKVYDRAIAGWQQRQANTKLVERISKRLPDLTAIGLPGRALTQENVSRFVHPSDQALTYSVMDTLSASQHWRANTPLPTISDHDDQHQFASPVTPCSYKSNNAKSNNLQCSGTGAYNSQTEPHHDTNQSLPKTDKFHPAARQGIYTREDVVDEEESYDTTTSLNDVFHVANSQYEYDTHTDTPLAPSGQHKILVQGTPPGDKQAQTYTTSIESYQQTQYPEEHHQVSAFDCYNDSSIVRETPPQSTEVFDYTRSHPQLQDMISP